MVKSNLRDFGAPENADHLAEATIFENQKFTTVESILPDRPIRNGSRSGGLRQNLVRLSVRPSPKTTHRRCLSISPFLTPPLSPPTPPPPPSRSADQRPRPQNPKKTSYCFDCGANLPPRVHSSKVNVGKEKVYADVMVVFLYVLCDGCKSRSLSGISMNE